MKIKLFSIPLLAVFFVLSSFVNKSVVPSKSEVTEPVIVNAKNVYIPVGGKVDSKVSLFDLRNMKQSELEAITGRKMNFFERNSFNKAQRKLQRSINDKGEITGNKLKKAMTSATDGTEGFHIGGFALGFLVGLIGVLIAYLINDDKKRNRVKWAWIGCVAWIVIYFAFIF
ncbi:MAG: hypothetical protein WCI49_10590 [Ferruginibacter sp.]